MSKRNRDGDEAAKPPKTRRRVTNRRVRHDVHTALHTAGDFDEVVLASPVPEAQPQPPKPKGRLRHWKLKSWKRRTAQRRARNASADNLEREQD